LEELIAILGFEGQQAPTPLCRDILKELDNVAIGKFWSNIRNAATQVSEEPNVVSLWEFLLTLKEDSVKADDVILLPKQILWLTAGLSSSPLLIRRCYVDLFEEVKQLHSIGSPGVIITGNPGIGKSYFLMYCLIRFGCFENKAVVFQSIQKMKMWLFKGKEKPICLQYPYPDANADVYLVDSGSPSSEPLSTQLFTILACSPKKDHYKEFQKNGAEKLYMPCWLLEELLQLPHDKYTPLKIKENFYWFGGVPRYVFGDNRGNTWKREIDHALNSCNPVDIGSFVGNKALNGDEICHKLFQLKITKDHQVESVVFSSEHVEKQLPSCLVRRELRGFVTLIKSSLVGIPTAASLRGYLFESYAHHILSQGRTFTVSDGETLTLGKLEEHVEQVKLLELKPVDLPKNKYIRPTQKNFAVFDSFIIPDDVTLLAFQMTVSKSHSLDLVKVKGCLQQAGITTLKVYYVVPPDVFATFKVPTFGTKTFEYKKESKPVAWGTFALLIDM